MFFPALAIDQVQPWNDAFAYLAELNAMNGGAGFAGHNDWRLPNVRELLSTVGYGRANPSIHPIFGPTSAVLDYVMFWSSCDGPVSSSASGFRFHQ